MQIILSEEEYKELLPYKSMYFSVKEELEKLKNQQEEKVFLEAGDVLIKLEQKDSLGTTVYAKINREDVRASDRIFNAVNPEITIINKNND